MINYCAQWCINASVYTTWIERFSSTKVLSIFYVINFQEDLVLVKGPSVLELLTNSDSRICLLENC